MKSFAWIGLVGLLCLVACAQADCGDDSKSSEEGSDVKHFFKNIGCKLQKGAEDLQESAKPWADKIGASAKEFGHSVAQKYDEIKTKLTDSNEPTQKPQFVAANTPTEKVPLAPLSNEPPAVAAAGTPGSVPTPSTHPDA